MNANEYQVATRRTSNNNLSYQDALANAALGLGEAGEIQNLIKKHIYHGHDLDVDKIVDECGDQLFYIAWMLDLVGTTMSWAMQQNIEKLKRRYPDGFSSERSINREE